MKKAVISSGGKQYIVAVGDTLEVEKIPDQKKVSFSPLLVFDEKSIDIGKPLLEKQKVNAKVLEEIKGKKVTSIRFKAKKRVHKTKGHRQQYSKIEITSIK